MDLSNGIDLSSNISTATEFCAKHDFLDSIDSSHLKRNYNADSSESAKELIAERFFQTISLDDNLQKLTKFTPDCIAGRNVLTRIFFMLTRGIKNTDK